MANNINSFSVKVATLPLIKVTKDFLALVFFTATYIKVMLHYIDEPEYKGYLHCLKTKKKDCILCQAGRGPQEMFMLPVYNDVADGFGILAVPNNKNIRGLKSQIDRNINDSTPVGLCIRKDTPFTYAVQKYDISQSSFDDEGADEIMEKIEEKYLNVKNCFTRYSEKQLSHIQSIKRMNDIMTGGRAR